MTQKHADAPEIVTQNVRGAIYEILEFVSAYEVMNAFARNGFGIVESATGITRRSKGDIEVTEAVYTAYVLGCVDWTEESSAARGLRALSIITQRARAESHQCETGYFGAPPWEIEFQLLEQACKDDGLDMDESGAIRLRSDATNMGHLDLPTDVLDNDEGVTRSLDKLSQYFEKESNEVVDLAGYAKELIESVAKAILESLGHPRHEWEAARVGDLAGRVNRELGLKSDDPDHNTPAVAVPGLAKALQKMVEGVRDIRNKSGAGHGGGGAATITKVEADLAFETAISWSKYVLAVYAKQKRDAAPDTPPF